MRKKQVHFQDNANSRNVLEPGKEDFERIKGHWAQAQFNNGQPIVLELACGRGEYTVGLAREFDGKNFVGVDIKGSRIWSGSQIAQEEGLENVAFLRTEIELLEKFFAPGEVSEVWVIFPDPHLKERRARKRLTSPRFLNIYRRLMGSNGVLHLKTDSSELYDYTKEVLKKERCEVLADTDDLYNSPLLAQHFGIQTRYERHFLELGKKINYLKVKIQG